MATETFKDRKKGFERKFQMDQELEFRARARRARLFGRWLAGRLSLTGEDAEEYTLEVVHSQFEKPGDEDLLDKVKADVAAKNAGIDETELRAKFEDLLYEAQKQVMEEQA